jgi:hypothetical protein
VLIVSPVLDFSSFFLYSTQTARISIDTTSNPNELLPMFKALFTATAIPVFAEAGLRSLLSKVDLDPNICISSAGSQRV